MIFSNTLKVSCSVCDCMETSFKYVIKFLLTLSGQKTLLIKAEKTVSPMNVP